VFSQLALPGSITAVLLWYYGFRYKPQDLFEKTLKYNMAGIYLFFFVMSFKARIEANWTVPVFIPLIILAYKESWFNKKARKLYYTFFWISIAIILLVRIFLIVDFFPSSAKYKPEFHKWDKWAEQVQEIAGDLPVIFENSYQKPSKYEFYTHRTAFSISSPEYRKSIFDYRNTLKELQGKKIIAFITGPFPGCDSVQTSREMAYFRELDNFRLYSEIDIQPEKKDYIMKAGKPYTISFKMKNNDHSDFEANTELPSYIYYVFLKDGQLFMERETNFLLTNKTPFGKALNIQVIPPVKRGTYELSISIKTGWLPPTINGRKVKVEVQ
jgi:hypothetical protein